jgi:hypothetical protein
MSNNDEEEQIRETFTIIETTDPDGQRRDCGNTTAVKTIEIRIEGESNPTPEMPQEMRLVVQQIQQMGIMIEQRNEHLIKQVSEVFDKRQRQMEDMYRVYEEMIAAHSCGACKVPNIQQSMQATEHPNQEIRGACRGWYLRTEPVNTSVNKDVQTEARGRNERDHRYIPIADQRSTRCELEDVQLNPQRDVTNVELVYQAIEIPPAVKNSYTQTMDMSVINSDVSRTGKKENSCQCQPGNRIRPEMQISRVLTISQPNTVNIDENEVLVNTPRIMQPQVSSMPPTKVVKPLAERTYDDLKLKTDGIPQEHTQEFKDLVTEYIDCFAIDNSDLVGCKGVKCVFELKDPDSKPIRTRNFPFSSEDKIELERQVREMERDGLIERSFSPYGSPVMLVKKHNGQKRVVVDMRKINDILKDEVFNTFTLREMVERVGAAKAQVFSLMDLRSAYHQVEIDKDSRKYVAFHVPGMGNYQYTRLPFGLKLSGNFFNHLVGTAIASDEVLSARCMAYVDDVFVYTTDVPTHLDMMRRLFNVLREVGLKIHNEKCEFMKDKVKFVGHVFGKDGIEPEFGKVEAMSTFPVPRTKKQLRSFIGLVTFYRQYIKNLSHDLEPLLVLLRKDERFVWNDEREAAFQSIREKLKTLPTLVFPDESPGAGPFVLETDASSYSIAGTLGQRSRDGKETHLIACYGRSLRPNEVNYTVCEKECLALISGMMRFKHIFVGKPLIVKSDNLNVKFFKTLRNEHSPRMMRWSMYINAWIGDNVTFEHIKGPTNIVPDALSRREYPDTGPLTDKEMEITQDILTLFVVHDVESEDEITDDRDNTMQCMSWWKQIEELERNQEIWSLLEQADPEEGLHSLIHITLERPDEVRHENTTYEYVMSVGEQDDEELNEIDQSTINRKIRDVCRGKVGHSAWCNVIGQSQKSKEEEEGDLDVSFDEIFEDEEQQSAEESLNNDNTAGEATTSVKEPEEIKPNVFSFTENDEQALRKAQQCCPDVGPLMKFIETKELPKDDDHLARRIVIEAENHFINDNGILCGHKINKNKRTKSLYEVMEWKIIPKALRREVLRIVHESSHPGIRKMEAILNGLPYRWPGMYSDIKKYVNSCYNCQTGKRGLFMPKNRMDNMEIPSSTFEQISIDVVGPLTTTAEGNSYILTAIDIFSNYVWLFPLQEQTSREIAEKLVEIFSFSGIPAKIITDLGQNLVSAVIRDMCSLLNIVHFKTLAYVHKSNRVERMHRELGDMMRTMLRESEIGKWDKYLTLMQMHLRSQPTATNPYAPAMIVFGKNIRTLTSAQVEAFERQECTEVNEYVEELKDRMKLIWKAQEQCKRLNNEESKERVNRNVRPFKIQQGMKVYLRNDAKKTGVSQKLQKEFLGPYEIVDVLSEHSVRLRCLANRKILKYPVHVDRIKPVMERIDEDVEESDDLVEKEPGTGSPVNSQQDELSGEMGLATPDLTSSSVLNSVDTGTRMGHTDSQTSHPLARDDGREQQTNARDDVGDDVYEIERIVNMKGSGENRQYLVKWKDSPDEKFKNTWVLAKDVTQAAIDKFHERKTSSGKTRAAFRKGRRKH